jgi:CHASE2 domain-containing sensor protein
MSKRAVLKLDGYLEQGFTVTLEVGEEGNVHFTEVTGHLPPSPELLKCLDLWQKNYRQISENTRITLQKVTVETGKLSQIETCRRLAEDLQGYLRKWLESAAFQDIEKRLREVLDREEPIRVLLRTQDNRLRKLPWHLWEFVEKYALAEIAFSTAPGQISIRIKPREKVRVLAILGNSEGIDIKADRKMLEELPNAEVLFLVEPSRQKINDQLWDKPWDIFFFAGHSESSENQGRIYINRHDSLTLDELKYSLKQAIKHGLQLAIFNSCDGLGLAYELEQLHLPQLIVMREPVPDKVAQEFLKRFLDAFARGDSLYVAERKARERLQGMEKEFPCASWLPVIFQNPTATPPTWEKLPNPSGGKQPRNFWHRLGALCAASVVVTGIVMGVRSHGLLQRSEQPVYDQMMRQKRDEGKDKRLMVVTIDDADILYQLKQGWKLRFSLSDQALARLLQKLDKYDPTAIGLYVPRDGGVDPAQPDLKTRLEIDNRLYAICFVPPPGEQQPGIEPPPKVPEKRQGFSNIVYDSDGVVRRHLLSMGPIPESECTTPRSFSNMLAFRYLSNLKKGIKVFENGNWLFGSIEFKSLQAGDGGYTKDETGQSQVMLNYRTDNSSSTSPLEIADKVTLRQIITNTNEEIPKNLKHRIVLIGVTTSSASKTSRTPYSATRQLPQVWFQTQMTSQILSAVLDNRPLIKVLPQQYELIWIFVWSVVGGIVVLCFRSRFHLALAGGITICILYGMCYGFFVLSYWVSFVPCMLAIKGTGSCILIYFQFIALLKSRPVLMS